MNKLLTTVILLCFSFAARGQTENTYLCIGEVAGVVYTSDSGNGELRSAAGASADRWLVSESGLKMFGTEVIWLPNCTEHSTGIFCGSENLEYGFFRLSFSNNTYTSLLYNEEDLNGDERTHMIAAGKCSKI